MQAQLRTFHSIILNSAQENIIPKSWKVKKNIISLLKMHTLYEHPNTAINFTIRVHFLIHSYHRYISLV